jgi:hypothetical protein
MRLFEVEGNIVNDLVVLLRNQVGRTDSVSHNKAPQTLTYPALASLMNNLGYPGITKDSLKQLYDGSDELKKLIRDPKPAGEDPNANAADVVTLKTSEERTKDEPATAAGGKSIDSMAKSGANYKPELS